jgi:hypothetical protein
MPLPPLLLQVMTLDRILKIHKVLAQLSPAASPTT